MDKTILVTFPLEAGRKLIEDLDKADFDVQAAFWLYRSDADDWQLYIVSPLYDKVGPLEAYRRILVVLPYKTPDDPFNDLSLNNITVISPDNNVVRALRKMVGPGGQGIRLRKTLIDNVAIEEGYIYRL